MDGKVFEKCYEATKGQYFDISHYDTIIRDSHHGTYQDGSTLFRFVKGAIPEESRTQYKDIIRPLAKRKTKNRGQASGPVDLKYFPKKAVALCNAKGVEHTDGKDRYSVYYKESSGKVVNRCQSNQVRCGVAGFFDKIAGMPCRKVGWSRDNIEKHETLSALARHIEATHKTYETDSYHYHKENADKSPTYLFTDSIYSTMTLNYDFRTASHKDSGDLVGGLSTLTIFEDIPNNYEGFYLGLPEYKIAFDLRDGDTLLFNAHEFHANTEFKVLSENLKVDELTNNHFAGRMSVVCYLRDKLKNCPELI